jgi:Domain of unknown function (DUF4123)
MATDVKPNPADTWQACVQTLHKHVHQTASDQCILWVNPAQSDMFEGNALVLERRVRVPIQHPRFDQQFAPYLLGLDVSASADSDLLEQSVQAAFQAWELPSLQAYSGQPICGWIITSSPARVLANYWAGYVHLHAVGTLTKLLRFHDPGVREWLWPTLSALQQTQLLGSAKQLIGINRQQQLMLHSQPDVVAQTDSKKLRLTNEQWLDIEDYAVLHEAWLAQASAQATEENDADHAIAWLRKLPVNWQAPIFKALQKASQYGITDPQDRALFAQHALQIGTEFHTHVALKDVWHKTRAGAFYGGALQQVTAQPPLALHNYLNTHTS